MGEDDGLAEARKVLMEEAISTLFPIVGEIGAGHAVTALCEGTPAGSEAALVPPLRYGPGAAAPEGGFAD